MSEHTLYLYHIEYHDHADDTRKGETTWAEDVNHAISMFYKRFDDCSVVRCDKLVNFVCGVIK